MVHVDVDGFRLVDYVRSWRARVNTQDEVSAKHTKSVLGIGRNEALGKDLVSLGMSEALEKGRERYAKCH